MNDLVTEVREERHGVRVTVNETETLWFSRSLWREKPPEQGEATDLAELKKWLLTRQYPIALNGAVRLLSLRAHSEKELCQKLEARGYMDETVEMVLYKLKKNALTDDAAFARDWARARARKGLGKNRIMMELRQKGISAEQCERALGELDEEEQLENGAALARKLLKRYERCDERTALRKVIEAMSRRGFGYDESREAASAALGSDGEE